MASRRDLHVSITGDDRGFGAAFEDAAHKAEGLDRELGKLERQQAAQERGATRAAAATRELAREEEKAALAARKMGLEVERSANAAEKAQARAAAAAKAAERGLLDQGKAARIAARADEAVERAAIKAAEAQLAMAVSAERLAEAQQKAAREAELAGAAQHLAALKAVGAVKEHNDVVKRLHDKYGDLEKEGGAAFREIEKTGNIAFRAVRSAGESAFEGISSAASSLGESGPGMIAIVVGALAGVPIAAALAEGAITIGIGGALAGLGLMATKGDAGVQAALHGMTSHVKSETKSLAEPFKSTWLQIAKDGTDAFDTLAPNLEHAFSQLAPAMSRFSHEGAIAVEQLGPALDAAAAGAAKLFDALGPDLPVIAQNLGSAIETVAHSAGDNAAEISHMVVMISDLLPVMTTWLDLTVKMAPAVSPLFDFMASGLDTLRTFGGGVDYLTGGLTSFGHGLNIAGADFPAFSSGASDASGASSKLAEDMATLSSSTASVADQANALTDAFQRLLDPEKAVFADSAKLKDKMAELAKALKGSHGAMNDSGAAARSAKDAFAKMLTQAETLSSDMINAGLGIDVVRTKMAPMIAQMYKFAGSNASARALVDRFAKSLGMIPSKVTLTLEDNQFMAKLHAAQGLKVDPKTGYLLGNNSDYFNKWLKANGLRIDSKTGYFKGNNSAYYNAWMKANGLHIDTKTGRIIGNTSAFWSAVNSIPSVVGHRSITVTYNYQGTGRHTTPAENRADGGIDRYAEGGVRRDLPPHIQDTPTLLYGETQTGGEAYIPLGPAKRARSVELLSSVANMFGLAVVNPGATLSNPGWTSEGGTVAIGGPGWTSGGDTAIGRPAPAPAPSMSANSAPASSTMLDLGSIMQRWNDTVRPATKSDVNSALKNRRTQLDQLRRAEDALYRARHARHPDRRRIAEDERRVAKERRDLADATKRLKDVEARYKYSKMSPVQKFGAALALGIKDNAAFIRNLQILADRGFGDLARQLLNMGGPQAEQIAAGAVKLSNSKLSKLQGQIKQTQQQQDYLTALPDILTIRSAISHTKGGISSWVALLNATGLDAGSLAAAVKLMAGDLAKTASGKALLDDMHRHGYARGGVVVGPAGVDRVPAWLTAEEYVVRKEPAKAYRPLLDAINSGARIPIPARPMAPAAAGGAGANVSQTFVIQSPDPHVVARESARELAWTLRG